MKCLRNNVILAVKKTKDDKSEGGIIIPEKAAEDIMEFEVAMIGPDVTTLQVGDTVLKPEVTIIASKRGMEYDLELPDGREAIVVEDTDIRVVTVPMDRLLPASESESVVS